MDTQALSNLLNNDKAAEHAAILRGLAHGSPEGGETPLGASLPSRSPEEMRRMHGSGRMVGKPGGEPNSESADHSFDPAGRRGLSCAP